MTAARKLAPEAVARGAKRPAAKAPKDPKTLVHLGDQRFRAAVRQVVREELGNARQPGDPPSDAQLRARREVLAAMRPHNLALTPGEQAALDREWKG